MRAAIKASATSTSAQKRPYSSQTAVFDANGGVTGSASSNSGFITINASEVPGGVINSVSYMDDWTLGSPVGSMIRLSVSAGNYSNAVNVETLFSHWFADANQHAFKGVALTGAGTSSEQSSLGKYQYSTNGGSSWTDLNTLSDSAAVYLNSSDLVRFVPASGNSTTAKPDLTARVVDSTGSFTAGSTIDVSGVNSGGSTAVSATAVKLDFGTVAPVITAYNDNVGSTTGNFASGSTTDDTTPTFKGTAEANSSIKLYNGSTLLGETLTNSSGQWSYTPSTPLAQGSYSVKAVATDTAGYVSAQSNTFSVTVDTNDAPVIQSTSLTTSSAGQMVSWINDLGTNTILAAGTVYTIDKSSYRMTMQTLNTNTADPSQGVKNLQTDNRTVYVASGEPFSSNSSLDIDGGSGPTSRTQFKFYEPNSSIAKEVGNVRFRINDIDQSTWQDIVRVSAFDAAGNRINLSASNFSTSSGTLTVTANADGSVRLTNSADTGPWEPTGSVLVNITGKVHNVQIEYDNSSTGVDQSLWISDVQAGAYNVTGTNGASLLSLVQANDNLDTNGAVTGYAITGAGSNNGSYWQYYNGSSWVNITSASASQAVFLSASTQVRWGGTSSDYAGLSLVAVDNSISTPAQGTLLDVSTRGGSTAYSQQVASLAGVQPPATVSALVLNAPTSVDEGTGLVGTVTLSSSSGNAALAYSLGGTATSADYGTAIFSNGVTLNGNGTLNVPAGVSSFTVTLPIKADQITDAGETVSITVGGQTKSTTINDTSVPLTPTTLTSTAITNGGYITSYAGDVNGDGIDDFVVSAYPNSVVPNTKAYVVFGKAGNLMPLDLATMSASQGFAINDAGGGIQSVHYAGDVNGDGLADVIIGRRGEGSMSGAAYVVYGKADGNMVTIGSSMGTAGYMIDMTGGTSQFGADVSTAGDFNGDGVGDLIIGAEAGDAAYILYGDKNYTGSRLVISGQTDMTGKGLVLAGTGGAGLGVSVSNLGDINGDGLSDVLMGGTNSETGLNYVVFGRSDTGRVMTTALGSGGLRIAGINGNKAYEVAGAGDVNGDGVADFIIGAPAGSSGRSAYVVFGGASLAGANINVSQIGGAVAGFRIAGISNRDDGFGADVSYAGDINGDGLADLIVGSQNADPASGTDAGRSVVVFGKADNTTVQYSDLETGNGGFVINGEGAGDYYGFSVSNAGDLNGDGFDDLVTTARHGDSPMGRTYVIYGGAKYSSGYVATGTGTALDELVVGTAGADTLTGGGGVDRFSAGGGNDTVVLQSTDVSNLASIANGGPKAMVDGGAGYDTLRLSGTSLDLTGINNLDAMGGMGTSRINSIERIDLATDTAANTLTLNARDVNDLDSVMNTIRLGLSADGRTWSSGTYTLTSTMKFNQLVVEGGSNDTLNLKSVPGSWTLGGTVSNADGTYNVYTSSTTNSQVFVKSGVTVNLNVAPLVLDMNGDGTFSYTQQLMDVNTDGHLDYSAWAAREDGVLLWNKFGNGTVSDVSQYAFTTYGGNTDLEGLRAGFDSNGDGVFDLSDAKFAEFGVWQDANGNGVTDPGEFISLIDLGVKAIHLSSDGIVREPATGVTEAGQFVVEMADGQTMLGADAAFTYQDASGAPAQAQEGPMTLEYQGGVELMPDGLASLNLLGLNNVFLSLDNAGAPVVNLGNGQADLLRLTATDLLQLPTQADGTQVLKVLGDSSDGITLDQLTANGQPGTWSQTGSVTQEGQQFNVYQNSADPHLQVLIDQHIVQGNVHTG